MWNHSDDYGVVKGNAVWLKSKIFPYEDIKPDTFQKWLNELEKGRWILPFVVDGAKYYYIQAFTKHQTINRPSQQRNPSPPDSLIEDSLNTHDGLTPEVNRSKENIKEEKEKVISDNADDIPPKIEDVKTYCQERGKGVDAQVWWDFYAAKGWMIGKNRMKDWKAAVRTWEKNNNPLFQQQPAQPEDPIEKAKRGMGL